MLLQRFLRLARLWWRPVFAQNRTYVRSVSVLLGLLTAHGRRTVSRALGAEGVTQSDWTADYRAFSRAPWKAFDLFTGVLAEGMKYVPKDGFIAVSIDDTSLKKSSRVISAARWLRDALSPPFRVNLKYGLRCLHCALDLPLHRQGQSARAVSVAFEIAPPARKPSKKASDEEWAAFRKIRASMSLPTRAIGAITKIRGKLDELGYVARNLLCVVDGGYTNRTVLRGLPDRTDILGRTRKDLALCLPAPPGGRRIYGDRLPTPEAMRKDETIPYQTVQCHYGGQFHDVRYKEVRDVLWRNTSGRRKLRLIIVAPTPYFAPGSRRRRYYRRPGYLITTDLTSSTQSLIKAYLDRWQIEVLHRDLKTGLGLGQAQVWCDTSVDRLHSAVVAAFALLTVAALDVFGPERTDAFPPIPSWRRRNPPRRASQNDLVTVLRNDLASLGPIRELPQQDPNAPHLPQGWVLPSRETYAYT